MVSRVQNFFIGLLVANEVPDSTSRLLWSYGITTADKLYTRIPSTEALESFLINKVRLLQGTDEGDGNYGREDRDCQRMSVSTSCLKNLETRGAFGRRAKQSPQTTSEHRQEART